MLENAKSSRLPFETATPLAQRLQFRVRASYGASQEHELADKLRKLAGIVIVYWEHKAIVTDLKTCSQRCPDHPWRSDQMGR